MINYIKGTFVARLESGVVVECNNIGYEILVPLTVLASLPPIGSDVQVYTELYVREDIMKLYGFLSQDDVDIFKTLIGISGIGPKGALGILSTLSVDDLRLAVMTDNVDLIATAKGIGKKTASKLIIELKDKLKDYDIEALSGNEDVTSSISDAIEDALLGLTGLGYKENEALRAIKHVKDKSSTTAIIKEALSYLARE